LAFFAKYIQNIKHIMKFQNLFDNLANFLWKFGLYLATTFYLSEPGKPVSLSFSVSLAVCPLGFHRTLAVICCFWWLRSIWKSAWAEISLLNLKQRCPTHSFNVENDFFFESLNYLLFLDKNTKAVHFVWWNLICWFLALYNCKNKLFYVWNQIL